MVILGIDAHKRTHTVVAIDEAGRELGVKTTVATTTEVHLELVRWSDRFGAERRWAVEDCRHLSRRPEGRPARRRPDRHPRATQAQGACPGPEISAVRGAFAAAGVATVSASFDFSRPELTRPFRIRHTDS